MVIMSKIENSTKTYHVYDYPIDSSIHDYTLLNELRKEAKTTTKSNEITCEGCLFWLNKSKKL